MAPKHNRARVFLQCGGHQHGPLCVPITSGRPVHPKLQCPQDDPAGYGAGGGGAGCLIPPDLEQRVESELRDDRQEHRDRGYILIRV